MNTTLFNIINSYAGKNPTIDKIFIILAEYLPFIFMALLVLLWIQKKRIYKDIALRCGYTAIIGILINFSIIAFYFHPRPFMMKLGKLLIPHGPEASFPSDHTTFMMSVALMLMYYKETRFAGSVFFLLALIGGVSRVFCGLHFPFDIFGSFIVSLIACIIAIALKSKFLFFNDSIICKYNQVFLNK